MNTTHKSPKILMISSYPNRPCGIATFSQDLLKALTNKFGTFHFEVCALENGQSANYDYPPEVKYIMDTSSVNRIVEVAAQINANPDISMVVVQHEFGLWGGVYGHYIEYLLQSITKPIVTVFHTVLPKPDDTRHSVVNLIASLSNILVVMTEHSKNLLVSDYQLEHKQIEVIPHGTHPVPWTGYNKLKRKFGYTEKTVLSTFGLLGPNKNIETSLKAISNLVHDFPNIQFLILGRTHPELIKTDGEAYRYQLEELVMDLELRKYVTFINEYLSLEDLLAYLKLTDIYLFSSKDPHQAVSGTFAYAMSCGCPIISTPIPHAIEELDEQLGLFFPFEDSKILELQLRKMLVDKTKIKEMGIKAYQKTRTKTWENAAVLYHDIFVRLTGVQEIRYKIPAINLNHLRHQTDSFGIIQFSKKEKPDPHSGYTIDDNSRALIALSNYYKVKDDPSVLPLIATYLDFIGHCQTFDGSFKNYVDERTDFHNLNNYVNLEDSNGRAIWALGQVIAHEDVFSSKIIEQAESYLFKAANWFMQLKSPRAIAFVIKGLYLYSLQRPSKRIDKSIQKLADKLLLYFNRTTTENWIWFEDYLTYANSILPEALLYAYTVSHKEKYKVIAVETFDFLLSKIFNGKYLKVISNRGWMHRDNKAEEHGEQPIDVAYTVLTALAFYRILRKKEYHDLALTAFSWFLGNNQLRQVVYDYQTGGCYDGLEHDNVNLNQGAESTVCYLMARLELENMSSVKKETTKKHVFPYPFHLEDLVH